MLTTGSTMWGTAYDGMCKAAKQLNIGDCITFGSFVPLEGTMRVPMLWHIIDKEDNKLKLLSYYFFEHTDYRTLHSGEATTWENSSVRERLNGKFYNECFNFREKKAILTTQITTETYDSSDIITQDKLFIPSLKDIENIPEYLKMGRGLIEAEDDVLETRFIEMMYCFYWLRDPGESEETNLVVQGYSQDGLLLDSLGHFSDEVGVRAVMWIDTEKLEIH